MRSDVYRRLVGLDRGYGVIARVDRWRGQPPQETVIQDVEVPVERGAEFLEFFHGEVGMTPVWMCPLQATRRRGRSTRWSPGGCTSTSASGGWCRCRRGSSTATTTGSSSSRSHELDGHKSLYSTSFYPREEFWRLYNGDAYWPVKRAYDPDGRLLDLYDKCVRGR